MHATLVEQEPHVVHRELTHAATVAAHGAVEHQLLLLLQAQDALLDCVLNDEARGVDGPVLADAVGAVDGLHLRRWVPPWV